METEALLPFGIESAPIIERLLEHREGADDVGLDEIGGPVDRAVDMALGGEVSNHVGLKLGEQPPDQRAVADVALDEAVARIAGDLVERFEELRHRSACRG